MDRQTVAIASASQKALGCFSYFVRDRAPQYLGNHERIETVLAAFSDQFAHLALERFVLFLQRRHSSRTADRVVRLDLSAELGALQGDFKGGLVARIRGNLLVVELVHAHLSAARTKSLARDQTNPKSIGRPEQDINRCLPRNFRNEVCPALGERTIPKRYPMPARSKNAEIVMPLYLERDIEHVRSRRGQLDINFEAAVLDCALHDNLHFEGAA